MALEAQEVAVRVRLLGGAAFKTEADGVSRSVEGIGAAGKKADISGSVNSSHSALTKLGSKASKIGSQMIGFGRTMTMAGVPIAALGYYAVKASSQFGQAMTLLSTQANMPMKTIGKVSAQIEAMAPKFAATPLALAQAMYPIESIGLRGGKALTALRAAAMGSAVGLDSLENTADAVTTAISSKIKGTGGPVEAMAIMDRTIGLGKMHLSDLTESFKSGIIPISQEFGLSFKQILAAAAGLTRVGIPANQVMARMRLTLTSMISPTTAGAKAMATLGLQPNQLADDLRKPGGLITALADLKRARDNLGNVDEGNTLIAQMFGKSRGMASIGSLLQQLGSITGIYGQVMGTTPATLYQHFGQTAATPAFKYKQIQADFYQGMIKLGNELNRVLLPLLVRLVPMLTGAVKWFGDLPGGVKKFLVILAAAVVVGGPLLMFFGAIIKIGGAVLGAVGWIGRLGATSEVASGEMGIGGFAAGLRRVIPLLGLMALGMAAIPAVKHQLNLDKHAIQNKPGARSKLFMNTQQNMAHGASFGQIPVPHFLQKVLGFFGIGGSAAGGTALQGGLRLVGEQGPEIVSLPRGASVAPSGFTPAIMSSHFSVPGMSGGADVIQLVVDGRVLAQVVNDRNRKDQNRR